MAIPTPQQPVRPFLKWPGGKTQLLPELIRRLPPALISGKIKTYCEPFIGSGALLWHLLANYQFNEIYIGDLQPDLVLTYQMVQQHPAALVAHLNELAAAYQAAACQQKFYYAKREQFNASDTQNPIYRAALVIFLNKTCFNGLFRFNKRGQFNTPYGKYKQPTLAIAENLYAASRALEKVYIRQGDFEWVLQQADNQTFVYFDPPYRPVSKTATFTAYAAGGFDDTQQIRLAKTADLLDKVGAYWMLSNSDPTYLNPTDRFFHDLYAKFDIQQVWAHRMINSVGEKRGKIPELLITNYQIF